MIMSMLNILGHFARVLIGCGATNSVSSHTFAQVTQPHPTPLGFDLELLCLEKRSVMWIMFIQGAQCIGSMPTKPLI